MSTGDLLVFIKIRGRGWGSGGRRGRNSKWNGKG